MDRRCEYCVHGSTCYGDDKCSFRRKKDIVLKSRSVRITRGKATLNRAGRVAWNNRAEE